MNSKTKLFVAASCILGTLCLVYAVWGWLAMLQALWVAVVMLIMLAAASLMAY